MKAHIWSAMSDLVDETVSELDALCKEFPYSEPWLWFDTDELHSRARIRERERRIIAECARYFKEHPEYLDRWSNLYHR